MPLQFPKYKAVEKNLTASQNLSSVYIFSTLVNHNQVPFDVIIHARPSW
jgi:hypothetical protein